MRGELQTEPLAGRWAWREFLEPEKLGAIVVLFWMSGPVSPLIPNLDSSLDATMSLPDTLSAPSGINDQLLRLSWYPLYVVVLLLALRYWHAIWATAKGNWPLLILLSWTCLSTLWSVSPADTARRSAALSLTTTFAVYLGVRYDPISALKLIAVALGIDVVGSAICALAFPAIGVTNDADHPGAWRGLFMSKNQLGAMMLIEWLALWVLYSAERSRIYLIGLGAALALLLLSTSKTPLFILMSLLPCLALVRRFFRAPRGFSVVLALALSVAAIVFLVGSATFDAILTFFGRDPTLTGRTDIWYLSWAAIQQRYWAGYGYGAFWANRWGPANDIWDALNWRVPSSHSGLLELWLGLGLFGVVMFAMLLLRSLSVVLSQAPRGSSEECLWRLGYFVIFVVHAITEPTAMDQTSVSWALFVAVIASRSGVEAAPRGKEASAFAPAPGTSDGVPRRASGVASGGTRPRVAVPNGPPDAIASGQRLRPGSGR